MKQEHVDWMVDSVQNVMDAIVTLEEDMSMADIGELLMYASMRYVLYSYTFIIKSAVCIIHLSGFFVFVDNMLYFCVDHKNVLKWKTKY